MTEIPPLPHSPHDYEFLVRRWRSVAREAGLKMRAYYKDRDGGFSHWLLRTSRTPKGGAPAIFLSAGIHGDEVGATEGLINWAEKNIACLREGDFLIFPCLNPWGVVNNSRLDAKGRDLNRTYHDGSVEATAAHLRHIGSQRFDLALTLHEDYDAQGCYLYEVPSRKPYWGEDLLAHAARHLPLDTRTRIEGRPCRDGLIRKRVTPENMPMRPEALHLSFSHSDRVFTFETPSEFDLRARAAAQEAVICRALELCLNEYRNCK